MCHGGGRALLRFTHVGLRPIVAAQPIPLTVIGGFLGSGKTTLLNHIVADEHAARTAILVNDFGAINIDEHLIAAAGGRTVALTNGCVCCSIGDDLTEALIEVSELVPAPEWILIEASGVSDPGRIAEVGRIDPLLMLDGVVVLVDTDRIEQQAVNTYLADTIHRQLAAADILVLNKTDLVDETRLASARAWLARIAPRATQYETRDAHIPDALLRSPSIDEAGAPVGPRYRSHGANEPGLVHPHYATWAFETSRVLDHRRLAALLDDMPGDILRAKGVVRTNRSASHATILQFAGRSRLLKTTSQPAPETSCIVFIAAGAGDDFAKLRERLDAI